MTNKTYRVKEQRLRDIRFLINALKWKLYLAEGGSREQQPGPSDFTDFTFVDLLSQYGFKEIQETKLFGKYKDI